ncbi:MAG: transglycosylase domain-containing protein, partial [Spirochaetales bacterium]|nr:transglycosylase domain-containing protein [Spirochaetales bacterium]
MIFDKMLFMKKLPLWLKIIIIIISAMLLIEAIIFIIPSPTLSAFGQDRFAVRCCDRTGKILRWLPASDGSWQTKITLSQVPPEVIRYVLQAEDRRFYWHGGTDIPAVLRSIYLNVTDQKIVSGASTITMQLARIIWPHSGGMRGKITETIMARIIEIKKSKKWILEQYLNHIPFGYNVKGYAAAAEIYFGKNLIELSPEEIALLCVIPRAPTKYNPFHNPDIATQAASLLLRHLHRYNDTTDATLHSILSDMQTINRTFDAPHFVNHLTNILNEEIRQDKRSDIKKITTTLNLELQQKVENIVTVAVEKYRDSRLSNAAVIILNENNEIIT